MRAHQLSLLITQKQTPSGSEFNRRSYSGYKKRTYPIVRRVFIEETHNAHRRVRYLNFMYYGLSIGSHPIPSHRYHHRTFYDKFPIEYRYSDNLRTNLCTSWRMFPKQTKTWMVSAGPQTSGVGFPRSPLADTYTAPPEWTPGWPETEGTIKSPPAGYGIVNGNRNQIPICEAPHNWTPPQNWIKWG